MEEKQRPIRIAICDFDNSFAPSNYVHDLGYGVFSAHVPEKLKNELASFAFTSLCALRGLRKLVDHMVFITLAQYRHVRLFTEKYLQPMLGFMKNCEVISANDRYRTWQDDIQSLDVQMKLKYKAAETYLERFDFKKPMGPFLHILSIGDSWVEHDSLRNLTKPIARCFLKVIKLKDNPTIMDLQRQLWSFDVLVPEVLRSKEALTVNMELAPMPVVHVRRYSWSPKSYGKSLEQLRARQRRRSIV